MNKKKIIFFIILAISLLLIFILVLNLGAGNKQKNNTGENLKIWIFGDDKDTFNSYIEEDFKSDTGYKGQVEIESFDNWEEYNLALASAIIRGNAPDIFVLNNNEKSIFLENIIGIDPKIIDPSSFRSNYEQFFGDDLITNIDSNGVKQEFIIGVPVGYESLGVFYNRIKGIEVDDIKNWASLNAIISEQKNKRSDEIPLGIGRGTTVMQAEDIATQFLMLESNKSIKETSGPGVKSALSSYFLFADKDKDNGYDSKFGDMITSGRNNLDLFSRGEISMVIGYPRMLLDIDKKGFRKSSLYAKPFPEYYVGGGNALVNYNYFVINKDSQNKAASTNLLQYMSTETGAAKYLDKFTYYLPGLIVLSDEYLDKEILPGYNIILKDFYNEDLEQSSFDKGIKSIYDKEIITILDDTINYLDRFDKFKNSIVCISGKVISLENLSNSCN